MIANNRQLVIAWAFGTEGREWGDWVAKKAYYPEEWTIPAGQQLEFNGDRYYGRIKNDDGSPSRWVLNQLTAGNIGIEEKFNKDGSKTIRIWARQRASTRLRRAQAEAVFRNLIMPTE